MEQITIDIQLDPMKDGIKVPETDVSRPDAHAVILGTNGKIRQISMKEAETILDQMATCGAGIHLGQSDYIAVYNKDINNGMSEIQTVKTAIHEMAHAKLHNVEAQKDNKQSKNSKEVEAESVAYIVCQHYGIDTSDYSFAYVATWSQGKEMPELKESLNTIREAAADLITKIDEKVQVLMAEKEPISFYVAECGEFHSMGEFHENLTLQQAVDGYKSIPSDRMNGVKTIGFVIKDDNLLANEYDLVVGN